MKVLLQVCKVNVLCCIRIVRTGTRGLTSLLEVGTSSRAVLTQGSVTGLTFGVREVLEFRHCRSSRIS